MDRPQFAEPKSGQHPEYDAACKLATHIAETFANHAALLNAHAKLDKELLAIEVQIQDTREHLMKLLAEVTDTLHRPLRVPEPSAPDERPHPFLHRGPLTGRDIPKGERIFG